MRNSIKRLTSRKFLTAVAVELAGVAAVFWPAHAQAINDTALRLAGLAAMVLAALGYAQIEASVDKSRRRVS